MARHFRARAAKTRGFSTDGLRRVDSERNTAFAAALVQCGEIFGIFGQRHPGCHGPLSRAQRRPRLATAHLAEHARLSTSRGVAGATYQ